MSRVVRRRFVGGGVALFGGLLAAACSPTQPAPPARVTGSVLLWTGAPAPGSAALEFWTKTEALLQQTHPNIKVTRESPAVREGETYFQNVLAAAVAGSGPDVYMMDVTKSELGQSVPLGINRAVDEYLRTMPNLGKIFPWARQMAQLQGKTWGFPAEVEFVSAFYSKPVFSKARLRPGPQTWNEFLQLGSTLKAGGVLPLQSASGGDRPTRYEHVNGYLMAVIAGQQGMGEWLQDKGRWDRDSAFVQALDVMLSLSAVGILPQDPFDPAWTMPADWYSGRVAMTFNGTWALADYNKQMSDSPGFEFGQFPVPSPKGAARPALMGGVGNGFNITAPAKTPVAAATFVDFLYSPPVQKLWIEIRFQPQPVPFKAADYHVSPTNQEALTLMEQEVDKMAVAWWHVMTPDQRKEQGPLITSVLKKEGSPQQAGIRMQQLWEQKR
jgi:ABC-type glycerol-3-phosphate transport system substrate-binding protein